MAAVDMPDSSNSLLNTVAGLFGGTAPNIYRALAKNPASLRSFVEMEHALENEGLLSEGEQAIVALDVSIHNGCRIASRFSSARRAVSAWTKPPSRRSARRDARSSERERCWFAERAGSCRRMGRLGRDEIADFEEQGLAPAKLLEIITIISGYTLATYTNNLMRTRIDPEFALAPDDPCKPE